MSDIGFIKSDGGRLAAGFGESAGDCATRALAHCLGEGDYRKIWNDVADCVVADPFASFYNPALLVFGQTKRTADCGVMVDSGPFRRYLERKGFRPIWGDFFGKTFGTPDLLPNMMKGRFLLHLRCHMSAIVNGTVLDTFDIRDLSIYRVWKLEEVAQ